MKAEAILNKIKEDAKKLSADTLEDAKKKVLQMQHDSHNKVADMEAQTEKRANFQANEIRKQMQSLSDLEFKKEILREKRLLIDKAFDSAKVQLNSLPIQAIRDKIIAMIISQAIGDQEISIAENNKEWFDPEVLNDINKKLLALNKKELHLNKNTIKACTGAVLSKDGIETNCTLEAVLQYIRLDIENEVADMLFKI